MSKGVVHVNQPLNLPLPNTFAGQVARSDCEFLISCMTTSWLSERSEVKLSGVGEGGKGLKVGGGGMPPQTPLEVWGIANRT